MKNHHKKRLTRAEKIEAARKGLLPKQCEKVVKIDGEAFRPSSLVVEADFAEIELRYLATPEADKLIR